MSRYTLTLTDPQGLDVSRRVVNLDFDAGSGAQLNIYTISRVASELYRDAADIVGISRGSRP
jgi:uncharacterized protein YpuA (DUF1002 family)